MSDTIQFSQAKPRRFDGTTQTWAKILRRLQHLDPEPAEGSVVYATNSVISATLGASNTATFTAGPAYPFAVNNLVIFTNVYNVNRVVFGRITALLSDHSFTWESLEFYNYPVSGIHAPEDGGPPWNVTGPWSIGSVLDYPTTNPQDSDTETNTLHKTLQAIQ